MKYTRYIITDGTDNDLHDGRYPVVSHLMALGDGKSVFRIECDDAALSQVNQEPGFVMPSLDAPADRLNSTLLDYLASHQVTPAVGDTVLNILRKLRDAKGIPFDALPIEKPY